MRVLTVSEKKVGKNFGPDTIFEKQKSPIDYEQ